MKLWMTSEVQIDVADKLRALRNEIEEVVNERIKDKSYGEGLVEWAHFFVIMLNGTFYDDVVKHWVKRKEYETRLHIDHSEFLKASEKKAMRMLCESLVESLEKMNPKKFPKFDRDALLSDFKAICKEQGWMK